MNIEPTLLQAELMLEIAKKDEALSRSLYESVKSDPEGRLARQYRTRLNRLAQIIKKLEGGIKWEKEQDQYQSQN